VAIGRTQPDTQCAVFMVKKFPKWKFWLSKMEMSKFDKKTLFRRRGLSERLISILEMHKI